MLRHQVFLKLENEGSASFIRDALAELSKATKGCERFSFYQCQDATGDAYCFDMYFTDQKSLDAYLVDPMHVAIAKFVIIPKLKDGLNSAHVFDFPADENEKWQEPESDSSVYLLIPAGKENQVVKKILECSNKKEKHEVKNAVFIKNQNNEPIGKERHSGMIRFNGKPPVGFFSNEKIVGFWKKGGKENENPSPPINNHLIRSKL